MCVFEMGVHVGRGEGGKGEREGGGRQGEGAMGRRMGGGGKGSGVGTLCRMDLYVYDVFMCLVFVVLSSRDVGVHVERGGRGNGEKGRGGGE